MHGSFVMLDNVYLGGKIEGCGMVGCGIGVWLEYFIEVCEVTFEVGSVSNE